jgi:hypothetical protein
MRYPAVRRLTPTVILAGAVCSATLCGALLGGCSRDEASDDNATANGAANGAVTGNAATGQQAPRVGSPSPIKGVPGAFKNGAPPMIVPTPTP